MGQLTGDAKPAPMFQRYEVPHQLDYHLCNPSQPFGQHQRWMGQNIPRWYSWSASSHPCLIWSLIFFHERANSSSHPCLLWWVIFDFEIGKNSLHHIFLVLVVHPRFIGWVFYLFFFLVDLNPKTPPPQTLPLTKCHPPPPHHSTPSTSPHSLTGQTLPPPHQTTSLITTTLLTTTTSSHLTHWIPSS